MINSYKNQRRIALMDKFMQIILGLTDKKFIPDEHQLEIKHENYKEIFIIKGKWDEECDSCPHCHAKNIIKDTPTLNEIILPMLRGRKTYLELKVPQFICKKCGEIWSANDSILQ